MRFILLCCLGLSSSFLLSQSEKGQAVKTDSNNFALISGQEALIPAESTKKCSPFVPDSTTTITFSDSVALNADGGITFYGHVNVATDYEINDANWVTFYGNDSLTFYDDRKHPFSIRGGRLRILKNPSRKGERSIDLKTRLVRFYY